MAVPFVTVRGFAPNDRENWVSLGEIRSVRQDDNTFILTPTGSAPPLQVTFLSETCFRVRFSPSPGADFSSENSYAVVTHALGAVRVAVEESSASALVVTTGPMRVRIDLTPFRVRVYRGEQLVHADEPEFNVVHMPGRRAVANFKTIPENALYCGFGEKAGEQVMKNFSTMTQFNYDNFGYSRSPLPRDDPNGPLNPSEALYASIPFMIETNPQPVGEYAGPPYSYGIFLDNPSQSYFNLGCSDHSDMTGKYYFGALFGELDYYFFLGGSTPDVLYQYTTLTGRSAMPPRYVFGFHQGCYGYYDRERLESAAQGYRTARIPCDGLHIDVDFQDNYRIFTHSHKKFPDAKEMLANLRAQGFKCCTNVSPLLADRGQDGPHPDEDGNLSAYPQREALVAINGLIFNTRAEGDPDHTLFPGRVNYGDNRRFNPFHYPPLLAHPHLHPNSDNVVPLQVDGNYCDFGRADVRQVWGEQYAHLLDIGIEFVWQDMQCPAQDRSVAGDLLTLPLDLMMHDGRNYTPHALFHNGYSQLLLQATKHGLDRLRPERRSFILARGGYAGMQRYSALWTGDSASSWDFLRINIPQVLNLGLSGVPISGCDIGGFADGDGTASSPQFPAQPGGDIVGGETDPELLTRWMQLGAFLPWYRNHYNGYTKAFQEPWRYPEPVPTRCRKYVELRYRLLQVFYDAMFEWTRTGMPVARALFLNDPDDREVYSRLNDQFFLGRDLLVAPVISQARQRQVYFPSGSDWFEFKDGAAPLGSPIAAGQAVMVDADLDVVPLFVRAGAILPMRSLVEQYVGELTQNPLIIDCYPGPDRDYLLYQDDGVTRAAEATAAYRATRITQETTPAGRRVRLQRIHDRFAPPESFLYLALLGSPRPTSVTADGQNLSEVFSRPQLEESPDSAWFSDPAVQTVFVKVFDEPAADVTITAVSAGAE